MVNAWVVALAFAAPAHGFAPGLLKSQQRVNSNAQAGIRRDVTALAAMKKIAVGIVGPGLVGGELMSQFEATQALLEKQVRCASYIHHVLFLLLGSAINSSNQLSSQPQSCLSVSQGFEVTVSAISELKDGKPWMVCAGAGETLTRAAFKAALADPSAGEAGDFTKMAAHLQSVAAHAVMFDTTASEIVSNCYPQWLGAGVHVCTPNKKVGSSELDCAHTPHPIPESSTCM